MSTVEKLSNNQVKLTIEVSKELFAEAIKAVYPQVAKDTKVDGFRPGKVPMNIFISRFGYGPLYEEAVNYAINKSYPEAVQEHDVNVVDYPKIDLDFTTISHDAGFTYTAEVYVMPVIELKQYTGLTFDVLKKTVTKKEVEEAVKNRLAAKAENVIKEGAAELGDTLVFDFEGFVDGVAFDGGKAENYELVLGSGQFIPGFEDQLVGLSAEEAKDVNVTFPENYHADLAGKAATFKCLVHEVKTKVVPELTEEFVKEAEIEGVSTVEEYQAHVQNELKAAKANAYEEDFTNKVLKAIVDNNPIDLPACMIDNYAKQLEDNAHKQAEQYKIPFEMFLQFQGLTEETFKQRTRETAENQIKVDLLIDEIAKAEALKPTDAQIEAEYQQIADTNKVSLEKAKKAVSTEDVAYHLNKQLALEFLKKNNGPSKAPKAEKKEEEKVEKKSTKKAAKTEKAEEKVEKKATKKAAKAEKAEEKVEKKVTKKAAKAEKAEEKVEKKATKKAAKAEEKVEKKTTKKAAKKAE